MEEDKKKQEVEEEFITLEEVIDYVTKDENGNFRKQLIITSDACYSGNWCIEAKKQFEQKLCNLESLSVLASTSSNKLGQWGAFRRYKQKMAEKNLT